MRVGQLVSALVFAGIIVAASACGQTPSTSSSSNPLVIGQDISEIDSFDPAVMFAIPAYLTDGNIYETLVTYKNGNYSQLAGDLATSWTRNTAGTVYTFTLRPGVKFSNGDSLTPQDVIFSFLRLENLNNNPAYLAAGIQSMKAIGQNKVQITLSAPDDSFLAALAATNFGVVDAKVVKSHGGTDAKDAPTVDKATSWLNTHSIGTGPYELSQYVPNQKVVLTANPYYWGTKPAISKVVIEAMPKSSSQLFAVKRGSIDVAMNLANSDFGQLGSGVGVVSSPTFDLVYLGMTTKASQSVPLSKPAVRQAVRLAIDYNGILTNILHGGGLRPASVIPVGLVGNSESQNAALAPQRNIAEAKSLLASAGYPNGFQATLLYPAGKTFDGVSFDAIAPVIQSDLAQAGIQVTLNPQEPSAGLAQYRAGNVQLVLWNWGADYLDSNDFAQAFSTGGALAKRLGYNDASLATLVTEADSASTAAARGALYAQIEQVQLQSGPWAVLVQPKLRDAVNSAVAGITANPIYLLDLKNAHFTK